MDTQQQPHPNNNNGNGNNTIVTSTDTISSTPTPKTTTFQDVPPTQPSPPAVGLPDSEGPGVMKSAYQGITPRALADMVKNSQFRQLASVGGPIALAEKLGCLDVSQGLPDDFDFNAQRETYGKNSLDKSKLPSYCALVLDGLQDVTLVMLLVAAIVSLILGLGFETDKSTAWVEGAAILLAVAVVVNVQAFTDYSKSKTFRKQQEELENGQEVYVLRGTSGQPVKLHPSELVVGDVLRFKVGEVLAADGIILSGRAKMDEAALTGESRLMEKLPYSSNMPGAVHAAAAMQPSPRLVEGGNKSTGNTTKNGDVILPIPEKSIEHHPTPFCLSGTNIMEGTGTILVLAVGVHSVQGKILSMVGAQDDGGGGGGGAGGGSRRGSLRSIRGGSMRGSTTGASFREGGGSFRQGQGGKPTPSIKPSTLNNAAPVSATTTTTTTTAATLPTTTSQTVTAPLLSRRDSRRSSTRMEKFARCCCAPCTFRFWKAFFTFGNIPTGGTLMQKLDRLAIDIGKVGLIVAVTVFVVMIVRWSVEDFGYGQPCLDLNLNQTACAMQVGCVVVNSTTTNDDLLWTCTRVWNGATDVLVILSFFITAVTILVVAVPEGLPLAVTLSLAVAIRRMAKDNNQVKLMEASETMGSATTICSDKTGTLTSNRMTCVRFACHPSALFQPEEAQGNLGRGVAASCNTKLIDLFCESVALSSDKATQASRDAQNIHVWKYVGNATDCALLRLAMEMGASINDIRGKYPSPTSSHGSEKLDWGVYAFPFTSSRKRASWVIQLPDGTFRLYGKGAPAYIFDSCTEIMDRDGNVSVFDKAARQRVESCVEEFQRDAMRTLAIAYRDFPTIPDGGWNVQVSGGAAGLNSAEQGLTLLAVVGIQDPLRPDITAAINKCRAAGVDVRMCTGDALETAISISRQCGILREKDFVEKTSNIPKDNFAMLGGEFDEKVHYLDTSKPMILRRAFDPITKQVKEMMAHPFQTYDSTSTRRANQKVINQPAFDEIWPTLRVLARCLPEDKLTLVRGLRASKLFRNKEKCTQLAEEGYDIHIFPDYQVVAVTGDGTNDAPALKAADVGFAMGITGTMIAQQACDIILMDDNFASIVAAVKWGRNVFDSISKFIQFQLTVNVVAITIATIGSFVFTVSPLGAVQMLWVNMIMDSLASLALAMESPSEALLDRPPYGKRRPMISRVMLFNILGQSVFQLIVTFTILFDASWLPDNVVQFPPPGSNKNIHMNAGTVHWTIVFNAFVMMQLFNEFNSRKLQTVERLRTTAWEWNVFEGVHKNPTFLVIVGGTFVLQVIIVQFGLDVFKVQPLTGNQWGFCIGWGAASIPVQFLINVALLIDDEIVTYLAARKAGAETRAMLQQDLLDDDLEMRRRANLDLGMTGEESGQDSYPTGFDEALLREQLQPEEWVTTITRNHPRLEYAQKEAKTKDQVMKEEHEKRERAKEFLMSSNMGDDSDDGGGDGGGSMMEPETLGMSAGGGGLDV